MAGVGVTPRLYLDANVFLYAVGAESPYRDPCRDVVGAIRSGAITAETSVTTIGEVVHHRRRRGDDRATDRGREVAGMCSVVHALDRDILLTALDLVEDDQRLDTGDAIHVATARAHGLTSIVSGDRDFEGVAGIRRIDPLDEGAMARLSSD